jgi:YebC/PmpR family DNA-binding regulatory protein
LGWRKPGASGIDLWLQRAQPQKLMIKTSNHINEFQKIMAGHSKFKNIMHRKGAQDKKRAKVFGRLIKELTVAARSSTDPDSNPRLRTALAAARAANMPKDNIERVLKRAEGGEGETYDEIRYEGYGPGGTALIVDAMTDNRNRTASEVRAAFNKYGGSLGETGSVSFMFDKIGQIVYPVDVADVDTMFEAVLEAGADNVETDDSVHEITCSPENFNNLREELEGRFGAPQVSGLTWKPQNLIAVDEAQASTLLKLLDVLDDNDDVQNVSSNFDISDDIIAKLT